VDNLVVSLRNRRQVAENTLAFHLEKPKGFIFKPGQALDVTLTNPGEPDPEGNSRMLSIASPPYADEVIVATRVETHLSNVSSRMRNREACSRSANHLVPSR
jgi:ferredoxin-NADP reductase